jgi:hypothetical protein
MMPSSLFLSLSLTQTYSFAVIHTGTHTVCFIHTHTPAHILSVIYTHSLDSFVRLFLSLSISLTDSPILCLKPGNTNQRGKYHFVTSQQVTVRLTSFYIK